MGCSPCKGKRTPLGVLQVGLFPRGLTFPNRLRAWHSGVLYRSTNQIGGLPSIGNKNSVPIAGAPD
jgi:hypothetical protein